MSNKCEELEKYKKAVRFEILFEDVDLEKANYEETEIANGEIDMSYDPKNLLEGLKKASRYIKSGNDKLITTANNYILSLNKIYKKQELFLYSLYSEDDSQYPAPRVGHYIEYIIANINKKTFNIDEAINILDIYLKNEKKPFVEKVIPDVGIKMMFDEKYADYFCLLGFLDNANSDDIGKIEVLCKTAIKLGSKEAESFYKTYFIN